MSTDIFDNDESLTDAPEVDRYFALNVRLLAARWRSDDAAEDQLLDEMDDLWWSFCEEQRQAVEDMFSDCLRYGATCVAAWPKKETE